MTVQDGTEAEWLRAEHETWQILRRKPGYVTHHIYQGARDRAERLVYSEWESKKALDGARQFLQGTPLARRTRFALPKRLVVELVGPVTSTKGLDLPETAVAMTTVAQLLAPTPGAPEQHPKLAKLLASESGHLTQVMFRGFDDPSLVGVFSHWQDLPTLEHAIASLNSLEPADLPQALVHTPYEPLRT